MLSHSLLSLVVLGGKLSGLSGHGQWALGGVGPSALKKTPVSRKDDFDINNVVGANEGAKFVERAQHIDICTPGVRPAPTYAMAPITDERGVARAEKAKAQAGAAAAASTVAGGAGDAEAVADAKTAGLSLIHISEPSRRTPIS